MWKKKHSSTLLAPTHFCDSYLRLSKREIHKGSWVVVAFMLPWHNRWGLFLQWNHKHTETSSFIWILQVISLYEDANNCLAFQFEPSLRSAENYLKRRIFFKLCQVKKVPSVNICRTCQSATDPESQIFKHNATYANKFYINKLMWLQVGTILIS